MSGARKRVWAVAGISFFFTGLFFLEYLPPIQRVHVPYDLADYHYPLDDYAFLAIRQHRLPEWDWTIYCGMSFAGNPQTAMLYPPMWLVFAANRHQPWLRYSTLEILVFVHVWLAFLFCYLWLRGRGLLELAAILGAGVFAYSGYLLLQLQHLGLNCAYAWFPFALWGIDRAIARDRWYPLWRVAVASAMCFLCGYPPIWFVFTVIVGTYTVLRRRPVKIAARVAAVLIFSLLLAAVQFLPTLQLTHGRSMAPKYSAGSMDRLEQWASYLVPNYFDFALTTPIQTNPGGEYLYLGPPALCGVAFLLFRRKRIIGEIPLLGVLLVSVVLTTNPYNLVWLSIRHWELLAQVCRSWYFLLGITLSISALAASGLNGFLRQTGRQFPKWLEPAAITVAVAWAVREIYVWLPSGPEFAPGWRGAWDVTITLAIFVALMLLIRSAERRRRAWLVAALLLSAGADYKAFGTSKRVNAMPGNLDAQRRSAPYPGMQEETFRTLEQNRTYRIAVDPAGPSPEQLRHQQLLCPQGHDPLISAQIRTILNDADSTGPASLDPSNYELLRLLGVRYFITSDLQPNYQKLLADSVYRPLPSKDYYYKVFEFQNALPIERWEQPQPGDRARVLQWTPEERRMAVSSAAGGRFVLVEQMYPGWSASIDGKPVAIECWHRAFQAIEVPPGSHEIVFRFRSPMLRLGAGISLAALVALTLFLLQKWAPPLQMRTSPDT